LLDQPWVAPELGGIARDRKTWTKRRYLIIGQRHPDRIVGKFGSKIIQFG
jgi:hypothetical protein